MVLKDKKTKITFHAGILTIGGTVIEIEYGKDRIFFDFGTEFKPELELEDNSLETLLKHNLVPHLDHIYDENLKGAPVSNTDSGYKNTSVFLSHCHLDHTRMVNYLSSDIPMYALKETKILLNSLNAKNDFLLPKAVESASYTRNIIGVENMAHVKVGQIDVQLMRVDHDAYGACGMKITTPDLVVSYTGDLRLHGFDYKDTLIFCEKNKNTDVLIIEGVTLSFDDRPEPIDPVVSEQDLLDRMIKVMNENPEKQITFSVYPGNVKRMAEIVKQSPRKVVLEASFAHVLKSCLDMDCLYYELSDNDYGLNPSLKLDLKDLFEDTSEYFWQITENHENLKGGGVYIHSDAAPLGEFDPKYLPFIKVLENAGVEFKRIACSGHAFPEDLDRIVDLIQPKLLIPIHSLKPEKLENKYGVRYLPKRSEII